MATDLERVLTALQSFRSSPESAERRFAVRNEVFRDEPISRAGPDLNGVDFYDCDLSGADLSGLHLEDTSWNHCRLARAKFNRAQLHGARFLDGTDLEGAEFRRAIATSACFSGLHNRALHEVDARGAQFQDVRFEKIKLSHADFSEGSLLGAKGYILDATRIHRTEFSAVASDPWSVLRRTYTGPRFTLNLLLLLVFFLSVLAKTFAFQILTLLQNVHLVNATLQTYCDTHPCEHVRLLDILLGHGRGPIAQVFIYTALVYNALRLLLTLTIVGLREQEERGSRSPALRPSHTWPSIQRLWLLCTSLRQFYGWMMPLHWILTKLWFVMVISFVAEVWKLAHEVLLVPT